MFRDLLATGEFLWGGRWHLTAPGIDCLGLAIEVRRRLLPKASPLPEFKAEVYDKYDRGSMPFNLVLELMENHPTTKSVITPKQGDLAVVEGDRGMALGTYIGDRDRVRDGVMLFGVDERPIVVADYRLANLVGYWRYTP
jgi:hypothetical protein